MKYSELFNDKSDIYASARPRYPEELYAFLASVCPATKTAWDSSCGNGQSAMGLVTYFDEVFASDVSENQIKHAFKHPNIHYSVGASEKTGFADNSFDLVVSAQALHWMNFDLFWPEVERLLKPEGVFAAWGYCWTVINAEIDAVIQTSFLDCIEPYWAKQNSLLWNHYREIEMPFESLVVPELKMQMAWNLKDLFAYFHSWSATRRCMDVLGDAFFKEAYQQVEELWEHAEEVKIVETDFCLMVGKHI